MSRRVKVAVGGPVVALALLGAVQLVTDVVWMVDEWRRGRKWRSEHPLRSVRPA
jgi:hypothetical protein